MPDVEAALHKYASQQPAVIGMNNGEKRARSPGLLDKIGVHFTAFRLRPLTGIAKRYAVQGMPTTYFVDAKGIITHASSSGALTPKLLEGGIDSAIAGAPGLTPSPNFEAPLEAGRV